MTSAFTKAEARGPARAERLDVRSGSDLLLEELDAEFRIRRTGEMESSELLRAIHGFHQEHSSELRSTYQALKDPEIVARGLIGRVRANAFIPSGAKRIVAFG